MTFSIQPSDLVPFATVAAGFVTSLYALRGAHLTSRTALTAQHLNLRMAAVSDFLSAAELCRVDPTTTTLDAINIAALRLDVLAFAGKTEDVAIRAAALAVQIPLGRAVDTRPALPEAEAERQLKALSQQAGVHRVVLARVPDYIRERHLRNRAEHHRALQEARTTTEKFAGAAAAWLRAQQPRRWWQRRTR